MDLGFTYTSAGLPDAAPVDQDRDPERDVAFNTTVTPDPGSPLDANGLPTGFVRGPEFGQATANTHYPLWRPGFTGGRTYLLSAGIRF